MYYLNQSNFNDVDRTKIIFSPISYYVEMVIKTVMTWAVEMMETMKKNSQEAMEQLKFH